MQKINILKLFLSCCLLFSMTWTFAQVQINEDFEAGLGVFAGSSYDALAVDDCDGQSVRENLYSSVPTGNLTSANQVGASNATDLTISFDYKIENWNSNTATPNTPDWGTASLEYSTDAGTTWNNIFTINNTNHVEANTCATVTQVVPAAMLPTGSDVQLRINNTWLAGDYDFYVDNFSANQVLSCTAPTATFTVVEDCAAGFTVNVDITDLGNATTVDITDGTNTLATGVGLGVTNVGPFTNGTPVDITIVHDADPACNVTETGLVNALCPTIVTCGTATTETYCYVNNDLAQWLYTSSDGTSPLILTFSAGYLENCCDDLIIYDGTDNTGTVLWDSNDPAFLGNDLTAVTVSSTGTSIFMDFDSDISADCSGSGNIPWDWTVNCLSCSPGAGTASIGSCDETASTFTIDVDVTNIGDGTIVIANDGGVASTTVMATGVTNVGPFPFGTVTITLEHPTDPTCNITLPAITVAGCPPANDECANAEALTVNADLGCGTVTAGTTVNATASPQADDVTGTPDNDVWFSFVATNTSHQVELQNVVAVVGTATDMGMGLYDGTGGCTALVLVDDSDPNSATFTGLTAGTTYYLRVYGWSSTNTAQTTFDVCVGTPPPPPANDLCASATPITVGSSGSCPGSVSFTTISATETVQPTCDFGGDLEVWYSFTAPSAELVFESGAGSPGIEIYDACAGTAVSNCLNNTSGTITGLTAGTAYIALVWTDGATGAAGDFCLYELTCTQPTFTLADGGNNCPADEFFIDVDVTDLGTAGTVNITNDGGAADVNGVGLGVQTIGPFPSGTAVAVTVTDVGDPSCNISSSFTTTACPPANDDLCNAISLTLGGTCTGDAYTNVSATVETNEPSGSCFTGGAQKTVWFSFIAPASGKATITTDIAPGDLNDSEIALYSEGTGFDCADLSTLSPELSCDQDGGTVAGSGWMSIINATCLTPGANYYVQVSGYNNSEGAFCIEISDSNPAGMALSASAVATDVTCAGGDGTITVTPTGGTAPYSYNDGTTTNTDGAFTNLAVGNYTITVTDDDGCTATATADVMDGSATITGTVTTGDETCAGNDGTLDVVESGGAAPYMYDLGTGAQATGSFTGLAAGMYTVTITDANSCTGTAMGEVMDGCTADPCTEGYEMANQLTGMLDMSADYETDQGIDSDQIIGMTDPNIGVDYDAGTDIDLLPGFEVKLGVEFDAFIDGCAGGTADGAGGNQ